MLDTALDAGHCERFDTLQQLLDRIGERNVTMQKMALISKLRADGAIKDRLIWDWLRSETNEFESIPERTSFPPHSDTVDDSTALANTDGFQDPCNFLSWTSRRRFTTSSLLVQNSGLTPVLRQVRVIGSWFFCSARLRLHASGEGSQLGLPGRPWL